MNNSIWAILVICLLIIFTFVARSLAQASFPIIALHNGAWGAVLALFGTNLIEYNEASLGAWLTLIAGLAYFNIGAIFGNSDREQLATPWVMALISRRAFFALTGLYLIGFLAYLQNITLRFGLATLIDDPTSIRGAQGESYLASVPLGFRLLLYLGPLLFAILGAKHAMSKPFGIAIRLTGMVLLALSMLALLQRTNLFLGAILLASLLISAPRRTAFNNVQEIDTSREITRRTPRGRGRLPRLVAIAALGIAMLYSFQTVASSLGKTGVGASSDVAVSETLHQTGLTSPFHYATSGTAAFLTLVDSQNSDWPPEIAEGTLLVGDFNPQTWGAATFGPVIRFVPGLDPWNEIAPFIDTGVLTNVFTWFEALYRDFRQVGVSLGMLFLGFVAGRLYSTRLQSRRRFWLQSIVMTTVVFAPFAAKFTDTVIIVWVICVLLLSSGRRTKTSIAGGPARFSTGIVSKSRV